MSITDEDREMFGARNTKVRKWYYQIIHDSGREGITTRGIYNELVRRGKGRYAQPHSIPQVLTRPLKHLLHIMKGTQVGVNSPYEYKVHRYAARVHFPELYGDENMTEKKEVECPTCGIGKCVVIDGEIGSCDDPNCNFMGV